MKQIILDDECYHAHLTCLSNLPQTIQLIRDKLSVAGMKKFTVVFRSFHADEDGGFLWWIHSPVAASSGGIGTQRRDGV